MVLPGETVMFTPSPPLATTRVPLGSVPMRLPATVLPVAVAKRISMPLRPLPAITLPPIALLLAPSTRMPSSWFPLPGEPVRSMPMKLAWTRLNDALSAIVMPLPSLFATTLRAPAAVPPIVVPDALLSTPSPPLPRLAVPLTSVPISFPATTLLEAEPPWISMPVDPFPEMMLRSCPVMLPPIWLSGALTMSTPPLMLPSARRPEMSVPMRLPSTAFPVALLLRISTPTARLPAIVLPAPTTEPPTVFPGASRISRPSWPLPRASVPVASVPMRLPSTWLPLESNPEISTPLVPFPEMTLLPITFSGAPSMNTPLAMLPRSTVPPASRPM